MKILRSVAGRSSHVRVLFCFSCMAMVEVSVNFSEELCVFGGFYLIFIDVCVSAVIDGSIGGDFHAIVSHKRNHFCNSARILLP